MSKLHHKTSTHLDIYDKLKVKDELEEGTHQEGDESFYKFKKNLSLNKQYETLLEIEKKQKKITGYLKKEPMDQVALKIRKGQELNLAELETWVQYNYLVLPEADQDLTQKFVLRQKRIHSYISMTAPVLLFSGYAMNKYHFKFSIVTNTVILGAFLFAYERLFNYGFRKDKLKDYKRIFEQN